MPTPNNFRVKSGLTVGTTITGGNTSITGFVNATSTVNAASHTVGTAFVANSTGAYHTGTVNAATLSVGSTFVANSSGVYQTGAINATSFTATNFSANSTLTNTAAINVTGQVNTATLYAATSANIASAVQANSTGVFTTGTVNGSIVSVGTAFIANTTRVVVGTSTGLQANGGIGTAGQVLTSNATTIYWSTPSTGTVTQVSSGNGLTGGPITSTGTLAVTAGNGIASNSTGVHVVAGNGTIVSNATGVYVNASALSIATSQLTGDVALGANTSGNYVATITNANGISGSSSTEGGTPTIGVVTGSTLTVNTTGFHVNSALSITDLVLSGNLTVSGTRTYVNTTTLDVGDNIFTLNADLGAAAPTQDAGMEIMRGTSANVQFIWDETNDRWTTNGQPLAISSLVAAGAASGITTLAAGNTTITGFVNATSTVNASGLAVGTSFVANSTGAYHTGTVNAAVLSVGTNFIANTTQVTYGVATLINNNQHLRFQTINTTAYAYFVQQNDDNFVFYTSNTTYGQRAVFSIFANNNTSNLNFSAPVNFTGNVGLGTASLAANGSTGTAGQVLTTNGTATYWSTVSSSSGVTSVATANGLSGGPITSSGTIGVVSGSTLTVNSTGIHVNSALSIDRILTSNNGAGTNMAVGDDAWFGDINTADTVSIRGQQSANNGYIVFGNADTTTKLGRAGLGALTYNGAFAAGNTTITGFANVTGNVQIAAINATSWGATITSNATTAVFTIGNSSVSATVNGTSFSGTAANATNLNSQPGSYYTNATNITTGTLPFAQVPALYLGTTQIQSTSAAQAVSGITTISHGNTTITGFANVSFGSGGGITGPTSGSWAGKFVTNQDTTAYNGISVQNRWAAATSTLFEAAMGWNGTATGYYPVFTVDGLGQVTINTNAPQTFVMGTYANGNVGFGNNTPAHKVSVTGTSYFSGITTHAANVGVTGTVAISSSGAAVPGLTVANNSVIIGLLANSSPGAFNNLVSSGDNLIYFSNNTVNNGNLVIGSWTGRSAGHGIKLTGNTYDIALVGNTVTLTSITQFGAGYNEAEVANTAATGTWTMDCAAANFFELTLTGSITISPSNVPASTRMWSGTIVAKQDATGGRTITWPTGIKWPGGSAPPATTTANAIDIWSLMTYDGGSTWVGSLSVKNVA